MIHISNTGEQSNTYYPKHKNGYNVLMLSFRAYILPLIQAQNHDRRRRTDHISYDM
jgi:hypothetical protein